MNIEIKGTGSHNKGAEMMLLTILQELNINSNKDKFIIAPDFNGSKYEFYSKLGIHPKFWFKFKNIQIGFLGKFIPKKLRRLFGIIIDEEIDVILDASGFAYSDQWGVEPTKEMAKNCLKWKKMNKKIIFLPQAFGPFEKKDIKNYMKVIIENSDIIYARDEFSYKELLNISNSKNIKISPDFTALFKGNQIDKSDKNKICIVTNKRMIDKTDGSNYEIFLSKIINKLQEKDIEPFFLVHGGLEDKELAEKINNKLQNKIDIVSENNPYIIKGIIESSLGLIGSRFHSLASSLYSGKPTLGTGWSHKYHYLFKEFQVEEYLVDLNLSDEEIENKLKIFYDKELYSEMIKKIKINKNLLVEKNINLFNDIKEYIGLNK